MKREIIDNFLPREDFLHIKNTILNENFPWTLFNKNNYSDQLCEDRYNFQFVHIFYQSPNTASNYLNVLSPLLKKIPHQVLLRAKANITTCSETIQIYGHHVDIPKEIADISKTAILYLNTNDGYTIFKDDQQKIKSKENRLLLFDSNQMHSGTNCTDQRYRVVVNINYI